LKLCYIALNMEKQFEFISIQQTNND